MKLKYEDIDDYVQLTHPSDIRTMSTIFLFATDLFSFFMIYGSHYDHFIYTKQITDIFVPLLILLHLWALIVMFDPVKTQKQYLLFVGIINIVWSFVMLVLSYEIAFTEFQIQSILFLNTEILGYFIVYFSWLVILRYLLKTGYFSTKTKRNRNPNVQLITSLTLLLMIGGGIGQSFITEKKTYVLIVIGFILLAYILALTSHTIYQYILVKKYEEFVPVYKWEKEKKKKRKRKPSK